MAFLFNCFSRCPYDFFYSLVRSGVIYATYVFKIKQFIFESAVLALYFSISHYFNLRHHK